MKEEIKFTLVLPKEKKTSAYISALRYCLVNFFGSFLSIFAVGVFILLRTASWPELKVLIKNGEVIIICISLLISAIYTFGDSLKLKTAAIKFFFWTSLFLLIVAILIFANTVDKQVLNTSESNKILDRIFPIIRGTSYILLGWSCIMMYVSQYLVLKNQFLSPTEARKNDLDELHSKFKTL